MFYTCALHNFSHYHIPLKIYSFLLDINGSNACLCYQRWSWPQECKGLCCQQFSQLTINSFCSLYFEWEAKVDRTNFQAVVTSHACSLKKHIPLALRRYSIKFFKTKFHWKSMECEFKSSRFLLKSSAYILLTLLNTKKIQNITQTNVMKSLNLSLSLFLCLSLTLSSTLKWHPPPPASYPLCVDPHGISTARRSITLADTARASISAQERQGNA